MKKFNIDLTNVTDIKILAEVLGSLKLTYTLDETKPDAQYERFKEAGIIKSEVQGELVNCNVCTNKFKSIVTNADVKCPECGYNTYVEPLN